MRLLKSSSRIDVLLLRIMFSCCSRLNLCFLSCGDWISVRMFLSLFELDFGLLLLVCDFFNLGKIIGL